MNSNYGAMSKAITVYFIGFDLCPEGEFYDMQRYQSTVRVQDLILHKVCYIIMSMNIINGL